MAEADDFLELVSRATESKAGLSELWQALALAESEGREYTPAAGMGHRLFDVELRTHH